MGDLPLLEGRPPTIGGETSPYWRGDLPLNKFVSMRRSSCTASVYCKRVWLSLHHYIFEYTLHPQHAHTQQLLVGHTDSSAARADARADPEAIAA